VSQAAVPTLLGLWECGSANSEGREKNEEEEKKRGRVPMVYFGPSKGCETCKRRRKKCDEARPSCMRCINANRTCSGYENSDKLVFRQYEAQDGTSSTPHSIARKCSLPPRVPDPITNIIPEDICPKEVRPEQVEEFALGAFFYDYPNVSTNHHLSRGYLAGLESMLYQLGQQSDLAKACRVVAFANHGLKLRRPGLTRKAEVLYNDLLGSLARAIENPAFANSVELLMIAMLLGLYEVLLP
jgi:hypothetical protein